MTLVLTSSSDAHNMQSLREENSIPCEKLIFGLFSDDARYITALGPRGFYLWEREPAHLVTSFPDPSHRAAGWSFTAWAFSPDTTTLAVSDMAGTVAFYQTQGGTLLRRLTVSESTLWAVAYSADGRLLATTSADGLIRVWDIAGTRLLWSSAGADVGFMRDAAFSPDGTVLVAVADDANVYVWSVPTGKLLHILNETLMANFGLAFVGDGKYLAVGGANPEISLFDAREGTLKRTFGREPNVIASLKASPRSDLLAARYRNPEDMTKPAPIILWDVSSGRARLKVESPNTHFNALAFNGNRVIAASWSDGALRVWAVPLQPANQ